MNARPGRRVAAGIATAVLISYLLPAATALADVGPAAKLAFTTQPSTTTVGGATGFAVSIEDASGNVVTASTASVTVSIMSNPGGATLGGTTTVDASSGVATFSGITLDKAGIGYTLVASSDGLSGATSTAFTVVGDAAKLVFTTQPGNGTAGSALSQQPAVSVEDANGSVVTSDNSTVVTLALAGGTAGATLGGTATATAVNGVATFSGLSVNLAGTGYTLAASGGSLTGATSGTFTVSGTPTQLAFATQPSSAAANASLGTVTVDVLDAGGNLVTTSSATVSIAISANPGGGTLSGTTSVAAVNGVATFSNLSISAPGAGYRLTASSTGLTSVASNSFTISGSAYHLVFVTQPGGGTAGTTWSQQPVVAVEDAGGNVLTSDSSSVVYLSIGSNPSGGTLTCTSGTSRAVVNGYATFSGCSISLGSSTSYFTLNGSSSAGYTSATSSVFYVTGSGTQLVFTTQPGGGTAGTAWSQQPIVAVEDGYGNVITTDSSSVVTLSISTNPSGGTLTCSSGTSVTVVNGYATFFGCSISSGSSSSYFTLLATSSAGYTSDTSSAFYVTGSGGNQLVFTTQPGGGAAGVAWSQQPVVAVEDANGNVITTDSSSVVYLTTGSNPTGGTLTCTSGTSVTVVNGYATFSGCRISSGTSSSTFTLAASSSAGYTSDTSSAFYVTGSRTSSRLASASAVGQTTSATFTVSTKIVSAGGWVTIRIQSSPALAGRSVGIWIAKKSSSGTWGSFSPHATVTLGSNGVAYYRYRASSKTWQSFVAVFGGDTTYAPTKSSGTQVRWM